MQDRFPRIMNGEPILVKVPRQKTPARFAQFKAMITFRKERLKLCSPAAESSMSRVTSIWGSALAGSTQMTQNRRRRSIFKLFIRVGRAERA